MLENIKRVGFLGLGRSNLSLLELESFKGCKITLRSNKKIDLSALPDGLNIERILVGSDQLTNIDEEMLILSPSVKRDIPELISAAERSVKLSSDAELFFEKNSMPVYAVTGSDGKSTTATLIHLLLRAAGEDNGLIGNIGEPMAKNLGKYESFVSELSSFMLEYFAPGSRRACITNITPNHLDWHLSFEEYRKAKLRVLKNANECVLPAELGDAFAVISEKSSLSELRQKRKADIYITLESGFILRNGEKLLSLDEIKRKETHNIKNLMMAIGMTDGKVGRDEIVSVAKDFSGLPHRCELFLSQNGVDYFDSSIDSSPKRTAQTLRSLGRRCVLILGGRSKGLDYRIMKNEIARYAEKVIICGENADEIYEAIGRHDALITENFESAVKAGVGLSKTVGVLLLSPASTSYDRFKSFVERGAKFKEIVFKNQ